MRVLTIIVIFLVRLARGCPPPTYSPNLISNATRNSTEFPAPDLRLQRLGRRWLTYPTSASAPLSTWPKDQNSKTHTIRYCYASQDSYVNLKDLISQGIKKWTDVIGSPSSETKHSLQIRPLSGSTNDPGEFCWTDDDEWNPLIPDDTLEVRDITSGPKGGIASVAWTPGNGQTNQGVSLDFKSIMIYPSHLGIARNKRKTNLMDVPLVKWKEPVPDPPPSSRTLTNCEFIPKNSDPSSGDADGIRFLYPWDDS